MVSLTLRLPDEIHDLVKARAESERRSTNAQIIALLESALGLRRASAVTPSGGKKTYAPDPRPQKRK